MDRFAGDPFADELEDGCPLPCEECPEPGDCEDCLSCLYWPEPVPELVQRPWTPRAPTSPLRPAALEGAREELVIGRRVGLVLRRERGRSGRSQSAFARDVGWSRSAMNRAENDAGSIGVAKLDELLRRVGHRLAVVRADTEEAAGEDPRTAWGVEELVVRDRRGRRFPPFAVVTWEDPSDRVLYPRHGRPLPEWTWRRPT